MAFRKSPPKRASRFGGSGFRNGKTAGGGSRSAGARSGGNRSGAAVSRRSGGGSSAPVHTVRIVIEQPGSSSVSRPGDSTVTIKPKKSPF